MTDVAPTVRLSIREGPVVLRNGGLGVSQSFDLWDNIIASEYFPSGTEDAFYFVNVEKSVFQPHEVTPAEAQLASALSLLALAWSFSGGSHLDIEAHEIKLSSRVESNAASVERVLLAEMGLVRVTSTANFPISFSATYSNPPLFVASLIAKFSRNNFATQRLLKYYHNALNSRRRPNDTDWFVNLYKVRDLISKIFGTEKKAKYELSITNGWSTFGKILNNNDLRHAEVTGTARPVSASAVNACYALARSWIVSYLQLQGLPAA